MSDRSPAERLSILNGGGPTTEEVVSMVRDGRAVVGETALPERGRLDLEASGIRKERTGLHAKVTLSIEQAVLSYDHFNLERDSERTRLANSAARRLGDVKRYGEPIKLRLDEFCERVWGTWLTADLGDWQAGADRATRWLIEPWILEGAGTILYGPPSAAKSWLTMAWALGITHGIGPWSLSKAPVLLVNLERPPPLVGVRVRELANILGCPERLLTLHGRGRNLADLSDAIARTIAQNGCQAVVVDSLSRAGTGDLTANDAANRAMDLLNGLGVAWCVIAHTPRADGSHLYGSVMFEAAADLCVRVTASSDAEGNVGVKLETTKANDVRRGRPETWALGFGEGNTGLTGFRRSVPGEFVDLDVGTLTIEDRICEELASGPMTTAELSTELDISVSVLGATARRSLKLIRLGDPNLSGRGNVRRWALKTELAPENSSG